MIAASHRAEASRAAFRNYWWSSCFGGAYFVVGFLLWGGTKAALVSSAVFLVAGLAGLTINARARWASRAARVALIQAHLLIGQGVLVWQQAHLPLSDYTASGNPAARDFLIYLVSALFVGTMSMFGGAWGAGLGLASHYTFFFNSHEEFSFKWVFPVLIALAGIIVSTAFWRLDEAYEQLEALANHDSLTGLFNRHRLPTEFERLQTAAQAAGQGLLVVAWDLDDLKTINDGQGHAAGDAALQAVARALQGALRTASGGRAGDVAFRTGGDEFLSLHLDTVDGEALTARVRQVCPPVSAGWVRAEGLTFDQALSQADKALYAAKRSRKAGASACAPTSGGVRRS